MTAPVRRPRRRKPFAHVKEQASGWWALGRHGIGSGPWETEAKAQEVADAWNAATALPGDPS